MSEQPPWPKVGMIVSFLANPESVALALPDCDTTKPVRVFCGTVTGVKAMQPHGPGRVPSAAVSIRGRTGKTLTIDGAGCYLNEHSSFAEAEKRVIPVFP